LRVIGLFDALGGMLGGLLRLGGVDRPGEFRTQKVTTASHPKMMRARRAFMVLSVAEDVTGDGGVDGLLAAVVFGDGSLDGALDVAVEGVQELGGGSLTGGLDGLTESRRFDVLVLMLCGGKG